MDRHGDARGRHPGAAAYRPAKVPMLIIDTYNVLHVTGVLPPRLAGIGVPGLVRLIASSRYAARRVTLVCDGGTPNGVSGVRMHTVHILYAGSHLEADDVIETLIERYHRGNSLDVVSTDNRIRKAARRRGARSISSDRFLAQLVHDESTPPARRGNILREQVPLDPYSVERWCREFGVPPPDPRGGISQRNPASDDQAERPEPTRSSEKPGASGSIRSRLTPPATIGEPLRVELPPESPSSPPPVGGSRVAESSPESAPPESVEIDPLVLAALEEWRDRLTLDDLDMQKWLPDAQSDARRPRD